MNDTTNDQTTGDEPPGVARHTPWVWPPFIITSLAVVDWLGATWGWLLSLVLATAAIVAARHPRNNIQNRVTQDGIPVIDDKNRPNARTSSSG